MTTQYKPLPKHKVEAMKTETPEIYKNMVDAFGEQNVINNLLVDFIVLTEGKNVIGQNRIKFAVTKDIIKNAVKVNNGGFLNYLKQPATKIKSWVQEAIGKDDEMSEIGHAPIILDHKADAVNNKQGYVVGGTYKAVNIDGTLHLMVKGMLINPEAKFKYIQGLYREVSPTIQLPLDGYPMPTDPYKITELSFVNIPAQITNTSLSAGDADVIEINQVVEQPTNINWDEAIEKARIAANLEKQTNQIKKKERIAHYYTESLLKNKVIPSSMRKLVSDTLVQLSDGEESLVVELIKKATKNSLYVNKPRPFLLKGTIDMNMSKEERYEKFVRENKANYQTVEDLRSAFNKAEAATSVSLSDGSAMAYDPMHMLIEMIEKLDTLEKAGALTDEHRKMLAKYCGKMDEATSMEDGSDNMEMETSMAADASVGDGKVTEAGGIAVPNNTSLSAPTDSASTNLVEMLQKGYDSEKAEKEKLLAEKTALEAQLLTIKQTIGV